MLALAEESARKFKESVAGTLMEVLWEKQTEDGDWTGVTGNYIRAFTESDEDLTNKLLALEINSACLILRKNY